MALKTLPLHFFAGSLNFSLQANDVENMTWEWQKTFLDETVNNQLTKKYPVSNKFVKLFLKKIIDYLEPCQEVHDDFYNQLCHVMKNETANDSFCFRHYVICNDLNNIITIKETRNMVVNGTTGMRTWEAALMLSDWALCNKEIFRNRNVVELGSGVGFTGITIAKLCKTNSLILTDCHNDVLTTISDNISINFPQLSREASSNATMFKDCEMTVGVMMLDWNKIEDTATIEIPDIIVGSDIVYDPTLLQPLCNVIKIYFRRNKLLQVYISSVIRNEETFNGFLKTLDNVNLTYEEILQSESVHIDWDQNIKRTLLKINMKDKS